MNDPAKGRYMNDPAKGRHRRNKYMKQPINRRLQSPPPPPPPYTTDVKYLARLENDRKLHDKNFEQFLMNGLTPSVLPVSGTAFDLLKKAFEDYSNRRYREACINYMLAILIMASYNPYAKADRGLPFAPTPGLIHALADGNTILAYSPKVLMPTDAIKPVQFTRKERRQNLFRKQKKMSKAKKKKARRNEKLVETSKQILKNKKFLQGKRAKRAGSTRKKTRKKTRRKKHV